MCKMLVGWSAMRPTTWFTGSGCPTTLFPIDGFDAGQGEEGSIKWSHPLQHHAIMLHLQCQQLTVVPFYPTHVALPSTNVPPKALGIQAGFTSLSPPSSLFKLTFLPVLIEETSPPLICKVNLFSWVGSVLWNQPLVYIRSNPD